MIAVSEKPTEKIPVLTEEGCPNCKINKEIWEKRGLTDKFDFIDSTSEKGKQLIEQHAIEEYPSYIIDDMVCTLQGDPNNPYFSCELDIIPEEIGLKSKREKK